MSTNNNPTPFDHLGVLEFCFKTPSLRSILGGQKEQWITKEVGDGNINFVWIVQNPKGGSLVLKQAADYIRIAPTWKLTTRRVWWERHALVEQHKHAPNHVPKQFYFDENLAVNVMEFLHPHIILRKGLIAGKVYPKLAEHISEFLASTLFHTSDLFLKSEEKRRLMAQFVDNALIHLTESVIFHEPYIPNHPNNHYTKNTQLEVLISAIQSDVQHLNEVALLKDKFMNHTQALIHGDMHTGSLMVTEDTTYAIDPEFAYFGPMAFDVGAFIGNIWLSWFSQDGYTKTDRLDRTQYKLWLMDLSVQTWNLFVSKFLNLWNTKHNGDFATIGDNTALQEVYMTNLFHDTLGFAACKMIRRIIGIAHIADLESIVDDQIRASCEIKVLKFASTLLKQRQTFKSILRVVQLLQSFDSEQTQQQQHVSKI